MAGVTNAPFRQLCREFAQQAVCDSGAQLQDCGVPLRALPIEGCPEALAAQRAEPRRTAARRVGNHAQAGLFVCEMITTRALIEEKPSTLQMVQPDLGDPVRSVQLYGVQPAVTAAAVRKLIELDLADHIDLNFGCPVPKVTRKGGGSALPWKTDLFRAIVSSAVHAAQCASEAVERAHTVPVTAKLRIGIDGAHQTFREAAEIAIEAGVAALTLHARTLEEHYSGHAHWERVAELVQLVGGAVPVFGNGDVFEVADAERMVRETGCDGVAIGRGAQGRPWIFYDMAAAYSGSPLRAQPTLAQVAATIMRHAELMVVHWGDEFKAVRDMRKHIGWYLRGFSVGGELRSKLAVASSLVELRTLLNELDLSQPYPQAAHGARGRAGGAKRAHVPEHWLDSRTLSASEREMIQHAEIGVSGG
ncbi:MAG: tRNA dihydrouridine synthase DusB [Arcanobacterium sp.]|nr:tRNA dihydrouridine synthase DusB [Arcanobacterium sp.]MDY5588634.1 tRNA dihydrouridine synthase DusB [Arcanobacterium sp.]